MKKLNSKAVGLTLGVMGSIFYIGCFLLMSILGKEALIQSGNLLVHGIDFSTSIRMDISIGETLLGIVASFFVWGTFGALFAFIYNKFNK
ncbi:MAG: hypothetical protein COA33_003700 [Fluviicola sp.]|nr:hypothetical protein [Fluviicola sp.]